MNTKDVSNTIFFLVSTSKTVVLHCQSKQIWGPHAPDNNMSKSETQSLHLVFTQTSTCTNFGLTCQSDKFKLPRTKIARRLGFHQRLPSHTRNKLSSDIESLTIHNFN